MKVRQIALMALALMLAGPTLAKSKDKALPPYILQAHTVAVMIDPSCGGGCGGSAGEPGRAKRCGDGARELGEFQPVMGATGADLIIVIRRGTWTAGGCDDQRSATEQSSGGDQSDGQWGELGRNGRPPIGRRSERPLERSLRSLRVRNLQTEIGGTDDSFVVFDGTVRSR